METAGGFVYVIKQLELALRPRFLEACATEGMTGAQYTVLTVLQRRPGITSSELARRSLVRPQTMAGTIDALLGAGLVRREDDPAHARRKLLFLTPAGSEAVDRVSVPVRELEELLVGDLTPEEREQFFDYLRRSRNALGAAGR
ncbi:MarR family winged helix-turn-helix transcriptional regulator [Microbacterium album]|uniref:HTH marR-type domain-containing protein n=1 Tax=Microbacterium album TaxID=2053191 RepID=A0A917IEX0_9MICO|nr:MarR family transcriptional regulator [Microbacterium album]GGH37058.1 hypothetical protein GCM10010921_06650 [Microbacterium album]